MSIAAIASLFVACLFATTLACVEAGRALGRRVQVRARRRPAGLGTVETVVFGLLGLLLALTFTSAASRFDGRRRLVVEEANAIGTAWLRLDLLPENARSELQDDFRAYTDARLAVDRSLPDLAAARRSIDESSRLQQAIWSRAVAASERGDPQTKLLVLPALNAMIDISATRVAALYVHLPLVVYAFLCGISWVSALFAGYEMAKSTTQSRFHTFAFALLLACTVYVILDFEYPRFGLIRVDDADRALLDVRRSMN